MHCVVFELPEMSEPTSSEPTVADMAAAYALDAIGHAKDTVGIDLDFSDASIEHVEATLTLAHDTLPKGFFAKLFGRGPSRRDILTMSKIYRPTWARSCTGHAAANGR